MTEKQISSRRTREEIIQLLVEYEKTSGVTVKAFCKEHQISEGAFYSCRTRYRSKNTGVQKPAGFIQLSSPMPKGQAVLFAEVGGIKLYQAVPADYLKMLIS